MACCLDACVRYWHPTCVHIFGTPCLLWYFTRRIIKPQTEQFTRHTAGCNFVLVYEEVCGWISVCYPRSCVKQSDRSGCTNITEWPEWLYKRYFVIHRKGRRDAALPPVINKVWRRRPTRHKTLSSALSQIAAAYQLNAERSCRRTERSIVKSNFVCNFRELSVAAFRLG